MSVSSANLAQPKRGHFINFWGGADYGFGGTKPPKPPIYAYVSNNKLYCRCTVPTD